MNKRDQYDEQAERLWSTTITLLPNGASLDRAIIIAVAAALRKQGRRVAELERGYTATSLEGWPCPGCQYNDGFFVKRCSLHEHIADLTDSNTISAQRLINATKRIAELEGALRTHDCPVCRAVLEK